MNIHPIGGFMEDFPNVANYPFLGTVSFHAFTLPFNFRRPSMIDLGILLFIS